MVFGIVFDMGFWCSVLIWIFGIEFEMIEFSWEFVIESDMGFWY